MTSKPRALALLSWEDFPELLLHMLAVLLPLSLSTLKKERKKKISSWKINKICLQKGSYKLFLLVITLRDHWFFFFNLIITWLQLLFSRCHKLCFLFRLHKMKLCLSMVWHCFLPSAVMKVTNYEFSKRFKFVFFIAIWTFSEEVLMDWQHLSQFKDDSNFTMLTSHLHSLTHSIPPWLAFSLTWHYKRLPVKQCKQYLNVTTINSSALQEGAFNGCFFFKGCTGDECWKLCYSWWGIWLLCLLLLLF